MNFESLRNQGVGGKGEAEKGTLPFNFRYPLTFGKRKDANGNLAQEIHLTQTYCTANNCATLDPSVYTPPRPT